MSSIPRPLEPASGAQDDHPHANRGLLGFATALGVLSAAGPLAIYLYLPALPEIARQLHASQSQVELSVTFYLVGLMAGQPLYGPLSDRFGRRLLLTIGLLIYVAGSVACALATTIDGLVVSRTLEGLGAGAAIAISAAVIRDVHTGHKAAQLMALRLLVVGISPIVAPLIGAALIATAAWSSIFWFATAVGGAGLAAVLLMPETRTPEARRATRLSKTLGVYWSLIVDGHFMGAALCVAMAQFVFTAYVSGSAYVFIQLNHTPPWAYSLIFGVNAISFIACAQLAPRLIRRMPTETLLRIASLGQAVAGAILLAAALLGQARVPILVPPLMVVTAGYGLVVGPATVLALRDHRTHAGTASALLSSMQWAASAAGSAAVAAFANGSAGPMTAAITAGGLAGFLVASGLHARRRRSEAA
jgi:DHA1 family bicyclomycin/chloramphenicol resistance-like MFS transporter